MGAAERPIGAACASSSSDSTMADDPFFLLTGGKQGDRGFQSPEKCIRGRRLINQGREVGSRISERERALPERSGDSRRWWRRRRRDRGGARHRRHGMKSYLMLSKKITELPWPGAHDGVVGPGNLLDFRARAQCDQITMQILEVILHGHHAHLLHRPIVGTRGDEHGHGNLVREPLHGEREAEATNAVPDEDQPLSCRSRGHCFEERSQVVLEGMHLINVCWVDAGRRKVERRHPMAPGAEDGDHLVPAPRAVAKAMDKDEMLAPAALHFLLSVFCCLLCFEFLMLCLHG